MCCYSMRQFQDITLIHSNAVWWYRHNWHSTYPIKSIYIRDSSLMKKEKRFLCQKFPGNWRSKWDPHFGHLLLSRFSHQKTSKSSIHSSWFCVCLCARARLCLHVRARVCVRATGCLNVYVILWWWLHACMGKTWFNHVILSYSSKPMREVMAA